MILALVVNQILFPVGVSRALEVTVSQNSVQVARGHTALLPCTFTTSAALNSLNIIWMVTPLSNAHQPVQVQHTPTSFSSAPSCLCTHLRSVYPTHYLSLNLYTTCYLLLYMFATHYLSLHMYPPHYLLLDLFPTRYLLLIMYCTLHTTSH